MIGRRRDRGTGRGAALALAALLGACVHTGVSSDEFGTVTTIDGAYDSINPIVGTKVVWQIESFVGKAPPHTVTHDLLVSVYTSDPFYKLADAHEEQRYRFAADDTAAPLRVKKIAAETCRFGKSGCLKHETITVTLADETLRQRVLSGYRIKVWPPEGEARILTLSPAMIRHQLTQVDNLVQGEAPPPSTPGTPRLGIGVIAATAAPFVSAPRGVIVVIAAPQSPAAAAGVAPGDVLLAIDAQPIRVTGDIARIMAGLAPGRAVTLELERDGKPFSTTAQL
jgi:hypothetical protein